MNISIIEPGGLNIELAILFADVGHNVSYFSEYREAFPGGQRQTMGTGFPGIIRALHLADCLDHGDIIVCPDTHSQDYLKLAKKYGKPYWGAGRAERLEQDRLWTKQTLKHIGLPVGKYYHGKGLVELEYCLKHFDDLFIKFPGAYRGTAETKHHYDWNKTRKEWWGSLMSDLGPGMDTIDWIAEEPIPHIMEVATDQMTVNGEYSIPTLVGIEAKDSSYIGKIFDKVPDILEPTNAALSDYLRSCHAKTFFSPELMIGEDKKCYLTDPCLRTGHPVSAVQLDIYENLPEYIIKAAQINASYPIKTRAKYGIALEVKSSDLDDSWLEVQFDPKRRRNVHLQCAKKQGDAYYVIPKSFIAATIVGLGDTIEQAEKEVTDTLKDFSCNGMHYDLDSLNSIKEKLKKGKALAINF